MKYIKKYFTTTPEEKRKAEAIAYLAALDALSAHSPKVAKSIVQELHDQRTHLKLIASENYSSLPVQLAMGNLLTDKYSEGIAYRRFYAGCDNVDEVESLAMELAKKLFGADHAYVQPHSGADANLVAFWAILTHKIQSSFLEKLSRKSVDELTVEEHEKMRQLLCSQKVMGMSLSSGGHLTHGYRHNVSAKMMQSFSYDVDPKTGRLDYAALEKQVLEVKPLILIAGYSAYPRLIDFAKMREIADKVGAVLLVDMAHFSGLVAGKVFQGNFNPIPFAHIVTSTTHKTLRGPRGGMVLCSDEYREVVDKGCPLVLGGPLPHVMAAKAVAFEEASQKSFQNYAAQVVKNAQALGEEFLSLGAEVVTKGTDNHLLLVDVEKSFSLTGRQAESALYEARLTLNRNTVAQDKNGPWYTSGVRMGTAAVTTRGMKEEQMKVIAKNIFHLLSSTKPTLASSGSPSKAKYVIEPKVLKNSLEQMQSLLSDFPLYPELPEK